MTKTLETTRDWRAYYQTVGEADERDLLQQVGRTIGGRPVGAEEIGLVAEEAIDALALCRTDVLLDLCCGNGLVTRR
ncbi:MAG: hypothetical protein JO204_02525, partial [Alphaproteobacteria bacterium]|nr:hypothetical protein [Alphaproteobacteria bacterium]